MAKQYAFEQVDVFTRERFRGNPLAVFTEATGLNKRQMQDIAKEMNLSETTFVVPSERADCAARVYIFTPALELPFAGHPTIGTAWVLAKNGSLPPARVVQLHENVGPVPVRLEGELRTPSELFLTAPTVTFGHVFERPSEIAAALDVPGGELISGAPVQIVASPVPFTYVPLRTPESVDRVSMNTPAMMKLLGGRETAGVFVFAPAGAPNQVYSRMLGVDAVGIVEDPATGSASCGLGAYLVRYGIASGNGRVAIASEQGTKMGRQSFISIFVERTGAEIGRIEVGGGVVPVLQGSLEI